MEKMVWKKPEMNEFEFAANDSVSACLKTECTLPDRDDANWYPVCSHHGLHGMNKFENEEWGAHYSCTCGRGVGYDLDTKESTSSWYTDSEITYIGVDTNPYDDVTEYTDATNWSEAQWSSAFSGITGGLSAMWTTLTKYLGGWLGTSTETHFGVVNFFGGSANHS